jgi:SAM-dependent methyltransferase
VFTANSLATAAAVDWDRSSMSTNPHALDDLRASYDQTPYTSNSFPQSAPGHLAAVVHLFGLDTAAVATARVLEIGCAAGGNLIPFAATHPDARVVGVDLSEVQIDEGRARAGELGLANLELIADDLARLDLSALGPFDFVIAHGVYSWVPADVQDALLAVIRRVLAPEGVAYVSYNTYPGWKTKEVVRDAMLLASGAFTTPEDRVREARGVADFLKEVAPADGVLSRVLELSREHALGFGDSYLLHDELETFNTPCYFYEMVGRADAHGLRYLAEAHPETMIPGNFGQRVADYLGRKCHGEQVLIEQYLDFVLNRMFRESLLVHQERTTQISYAVDRSRFRDLHIAAWTPPVDGEIRLDDSVQEFVGQEGATLATDDPGAKAAIDALCTRWPWTLSRTELIAETRARLDFAGVAAAENLPDHVDDLMGLLILQGTARFRLDPVTGPPAFDETARRLAETTSGGEHAVTFTPWHETLVLSDIDRVLVPLLDGSRDRAALVAALAPVLDADAAGDYLDALPQHLAELKLRRP